MAARLGLLWRRVGVQALCRPGNSCYMRGSVKGMEAYKPQPLAMYSSSSGESKDDHTHEQGEAGPDLGASFMESEEEDVDIKKQILDASLQFVHEHGWTSDAISTGVQSLGLSSMAEGMLPRAAGDLVLHFIEECNADLADHLHSSAKDHSDEQTDNTMMRTSRVIIQDALEVRLRMLIPFVDKWPQAMGLMLLPQNAPDAVKNVAYMVDEIWYHAGDTSTDVDWYAKRGALASLYGATELYMIRDKSHDFEQTWEFLDRRLTDIDTMVQAKGTFEKMGSDTAQLLSAAFKTVRNMSGFNSRNR